MTRPGMLDVICAYLVFAVTGGYAAACAFGHEPSMRELGTCIGMVGFLVAGVRIYTLELLYRAKGEWK